MEAEQDGQEDRDNQEITGMYLQVSPSGVDLQSCLQWDGQSVGRIL